LGGILINAEAGANEVKGLALKWRMDLQGGFLCYNSNLPKTMVLDSRFRRRF